MGRLFPRWGSNSACITALHPLFGNRTSRNVCHVPLHLPWWILWMEWGTAAKARPRTSGPNQSHQSPVFPCMKPKWCAGCSENLERWCGVSLVWLLPWIPWNPHIIRGWRHSPCMQNSQNRGQQNHSEHQEFICRSDANYLLLLLLKIASVIPWYSHENHL